MKSDLLRLRRDIESGVAKSTASKIAPPSPLSLAFTAAFVLLIAVAATVTAGFFLRKYAPTPPPD
jgi:hypothetical protein